MYIVLNLTLQIEEGLSNTIIIIIILLNKSFDFITLSNTK